MTRKLESAIGSVQKISGSVQRNRHYPPAAASSCAQLDIIRRFFEVSNFLAMVQLASMRLWLRVYESSCNLWLLPRAG